MATNRISPLDKYLGQARNAIRMNRWPEVQEAAAQAVKLAPAHPEAHFYLAQCAFRQNMADVAIRHFRIARKAAPDDASLNNALADALHMTGDIEEAIKHYLIALRATPADPQVLNSLGVALSKAERSGEAISYLQQAISIAPARAQFHINLGNALKEDGQTQAAIVAYRKALELNPNAASAHYNLGLLLQTEATVQESVDHLYRACELRPEMADAFVGLGESLRHQRRFDESLECFARARQLTPQSVDVEVGEGNALLGLNRPDEAIMCFEKAISMAPGNDRAYGFLGRAWLESGDHQKAIEFSRRQLELNPSRVSAYHRIAVSRKARPEDMPLVEEIEARLASIKGKNEKGEISLHFALGKMYDDMKNWDRAFEHFAAGNEIVNAKQNPPYSAADDAAFVDKLISGFNPETYQALSFLGVGSKAPVCIVGMPRSGTTLTEQIISSHPGVVAAGEVAFWGGMPSAMPHMVGEGSTYPECITRLTRDDAESTAMKYLQLLKKIAGPTDTHLHITDKMPHNFMHLGLIALIFPNVRFVHCKRDPMDNCLSIFFQNFAGTHTYAYDQANLGSHYKNYQRLMRHWHETLPGRIFDIQYENLIADPEYWSRKLLEHVGLEWDDACLAPHRLERTVKTASHWQVRQPIYKTSVERWRNYENYLAPLKHALGIR